MLLKSHAKLTAFTRSCGVRKCQPSLYELLAVDAGARVVDVKYWSSALSDSMLLGWTFGCTLAFPSSEADDGSVSWRLIVLLRR